MVKKIGLLERKRGRWNVLFDEGSWIMGVYKPEFTRRDEIKELEKHNFPEMFYLVEGEIMLLLKEDKGRLKELALEPGEAVILDCWHNAYSPDGRGTALVMERKGIKTEFMKIE